MISARFFIALVPAVCLISSCAFENRFVDEETKQGLAEYKQGPLHWSISMSQDRNGDLNISFIISSKTEEYQIDNFNLTLLDKKGLNSFKLKKLTTYDGKINQSREFTNVDSAFIKNKNDDLTIKGRYFVWLDFAVPKNTSTKTCRVGIDANIRTKDGLSYKINERLQFERQWNLHFITWGH